jgi:hypothetical protein
MRYTREQLNEKSAKELKRIAYHEMGIQGITKKPKDVVISAILENQASNPVGISGFAPSSDAAPSSGPISEMHGGFKTVRDGSGYQTTIQVSCGASSGNFQVLGKTIGEVKGLLRDVLNIDASASGLVNGSNQSDAYVLKEGDKLEFLRAAGRKGC